MMLTTARIVSRRVATANIAPRAAAAIGSTRCLSIGDVLNKKEKVEEDRYIRAREAQVAAAKAAAAAADTKAAELAAKSEQLIEAKTASMNEVADLLAQSGDVVSEAGLANLADWKHA
uniref:Uncharacterized protein n=2 Tax=Eukaryota TaxID=2759 RepID=A0A7S4DG48_HETAK|mmetsp:Transcript_7136/g.10942  ORF Transcript_7136/g.10942 Transcript_7136/m.10942 type:complete len:118 (-) Transcript_7136:198-551(-)|eukprot:scaffold5745_cov96-Skeletonema_dohrnii-CCMP3373.AAC.2